MIVFDIETGPLPRDEVLARSDPFPPFVPMGEFDPAAVKLGNLKDAAKIKEKIEAKRQEWEKAAAGAADKYAEEKAAYEEKLVQNAALSATTAEILAIGYQTADGPMVDDSPEREQLVRFWQVAIEAKSAGETLVGFFSNGFDLPFIVRRSWFHDVTVPPWILDKGRFWHPVFVDLAAIWKLGTGDRISLDAASKFFGGPGKNGEGAEFARLWRGTEEERAKAVEYLVNDLAETLRVAQRMGVA